MSIGRAGWLLLAAGLVYGQDRAQIERWVGAHQRQVVTELDGLAAIPNVGTDRPNIRRNAEAVRALLARHGLKAELLETAGNPLVYGEKNADGARSTILFYIHYDGQPVDAARWKQEGGPFHPVMRDGRLEDGARTIGNFTQLERFPDNWRLYARSASDDKAPIVALMAALDAVGRTRANIHVIVDGEEEMNSPSLPAAIARYRHKLACNLLLILDGPVHATNRPTLAFGVRGLLTLTLTVYGPKMALHSGHYGNWIPNPAMRLAQLLASMKDDQGRTTIAGFYSDIPPLTPAVRKILHSVPDDEAGLLKFFGVARPDAVGESLQEALQYPSFNIRGLTSGYVEHPRTIIPPDATAAIDIRLVKETPSAHMLELVRAHIGKQGYHLVDGAPDDATRMRYPKLARLEVSEQVQEAYRTEPDSPEAAKVTEALTKMWGAPPIQIRTMGGTVPIAPFIQVLNVPAVSVPIVNFDNNQHSDNENLRMGNLWQGIATLAAAAEIEP